MNSHSPTETFLSLRKWTGYVGASLPWIVAIYAGKVAGSISGYYHEPRARNWFVGSLFSVGAFLCSYVGYDRTDRVMSAVAGLCAFGVAMFPTDAEGAPATAVGRVHLGFAAALFAILAWFSLCQFTKSTKPEPTPEKLKRNRVYRACGWTMYAALGLILLLFITGLKDRLGGLRPVFWLESLCLTAFGVSWMVKGEVILKD